MTPATTTHTQIGTDPLEEAGVSLGEAATSDPEAEGVGVAVATTFATVNVIL